jgi:hypothetical protein
MTKKRVNMIKRYYDKKLFKKMAYFTTGWYNIHMNFLLVIGSYLKWHYSKAIYNVFSIWKNISIFIFNFFSIKSLFFNLFSPWKRLSENYPKFINIKEYLGTLIVNTIMRVVGVLLRSFMLILGLFCFCIFLITLPFIIIIWLIFPLIILYLIITGIILIFFS